MSKRDIAKELDRAHKLVCQAGFLLVIQIVRRRFRAATVEEAVSKCEQAMSIMQRLISNGGDRG